MTHKLVISIINFRTADLSIQCAQSALSECVGNDVQVVIVDNGSGDGSAAQIESWIAALPPGTPMQLIKSEQNTGFSGGHNQIISAVDAQYYLLLNSDAIIRRGFVQAILTAADTYPDAGLIAPQIETDEGEIQVSCFRFHSWTSEFIRGAGSGPVTRLFRGSVIALDPPVDPDDIEWASFACILLKNRMIEEIGLMDEGYFLYFEDAEYGLRARRAGWGVHQTTDAVAVHFRGGSGPVKTLEKQKKRLPKYYYASRARFFQQRYGWYGALVANCVWCAGRLLNLSRWLLGKSSHPTMEREMLDIWINTLRQNGPRCAPHELGDNQ